ncbi:MAG TPA: DUF4147 domain-containing protein [Pirellulales bacterium]|jgi:hydroxypyruvate reductase|nr:DUF4147 domain-containing protein [Pirellulales bacterium]
MPRSLAQLRSAALAIWQAGVAAVRPETLFADHLQLDGRTLWIADEPYDLDAIERIAVVGGGKAAGAMAAALEQTLGEAWADEKRLTGWVNVPADCLRPTRWVHLHAARPAGRNEPTAAGVAGAEQIMQLVAGLTPRDLCICLLSGGGSALLPLPVAEISLADKLAITQHLSAAGANIHELNTVRKHLSEIKGGGLARACRAGQLVALILSDVIGDPLDIIASGPTVVDDSTPAAALEILKRFGAAAAGIAPRALDFLRAQPAKKAQPSCRVRNVILGNNAVAVDGAGTRAEQLGFSHAMISEANEGTAEEVGRHLARMAAHMQCQSTGPNCLISGGEPVVKLASAAERGLGGRNQQLALAALLALAAQPDGGAGIVLLSGGTDGEDGPTDAAGAIVASDLLAEAKRRGLDPADFLRRNDAYHFFEPLGALLKTGPTQTNVCDLRVIVVDRA